MCIAIISSFAFTELYGYLALLIAIFIEGEVSVITASFAAHRGYLDIFVVFIIAFSATIASDWFWFFIGRRHGSRVLSKKQSFANKAKKVNTFLNRYPTLILIGYRFLYGFRIVVPVVIGMSDIKIKKFLFLSAIGTIFWAGIMTSAGYLFGEVLEANFKKLEHYEVRIIAFMLISGFILALILWYIKKKKNEKNSNL